MKKFNIEKLSIAKLSEEQQVDYLKETGEAVTAFQMVKFVIDFFGNKEEFTLDTKILADGRQLVVDGNGWIESGFEVA